MMLGIGGAAMADCATGKRLTLNVIREPAAVAMSHRMREVCWDFGIPPRGW